MLVYKSGNILEATENIICHQVNVQGVMGGGLAKQIANKYPHVEEKYQMFCKENNNNYEIMNGMHKSVVINEDQLICNCFTQKPDFDTDYDALYECFEHIVTTSKKSGLSIAVPFKYGCGIAHGDWNIVSNIFKELSDKYEVDISVYKLEEKV